MSKNKRVVDKELCDRTKHTPCAVCGQVPAGDVHHVTTRGAGGGDTKENLMPLCRAHHTEIHAIGYGKALTQWPRLHGWLERMGRTDILDRVKFKGTK